jgi:predicted SprT family Zn-dependent metalloprotease
LGTRQLDRQLDLFGARLWNRPRRVAAASELADHLSTLVGEQVRLVVHDNRSTMVSFRRAGRLLHYRVHHMFLDAPREVVHALATFAGPGRGLAARRRDAGERIDAYVREHRARIGDPRPARLQARGRFHDLQAIYDRLNAAHFGGLVEARIGWGPNRGGRRRGRRTIKTGVYVQDARLIRIHPALDRAEVPELYVAAVVHHEMLHQVVPTVERNGRRVVHGAEFRRREREYPDHQRAKEWEERNLTLLLEA